jgi:hypothetical protein
VHRERLGVEAVEGCNDCAESGVFGRHGFEGAEVARDGLIEGMIDALEVRAWG